MTDSLENERKILLREHEMPTQWYNIQADLPKPLLPPLNPKTKEPVKPEDLLPLFPMELIKQEVSTERYIDIPLEVQEVYKAWRPTPLFRAVALEKYLGTTAKIYYKYEGVSPSGSHKLNTAAPQAYYNAKEGVKKLTTETGAGQWGTALSYACKKFGLECEVYMVKLSYLQKPHRKTLMNTFGATVIPSPSDKTEMGKKALQENPDSPGSLGIAISEAVEVAAKDPNSRYALGSVLNHVMLHQTIIGLEAEKQLAKVGEFPDIVIAPFGGGSNFSGISYPFLRHKLQSGKKVDCIAVEPASCPKLTKGEFRYDFGDTFGLTPLIPMYTLGHNFLPAPMHAGGLRYHGAGAIVSQLLNEKLISAVAIQQLECFEAGIKFAQLEGILPAPEANHAIAQVFRSAIQAREEKKSPTILFNLCGHGHFDMQAYSDYNEGKLTNHFLPEEELTKYLKELGDFPKVPNQK